MDKTGSYDPSTRTTTWTVNYNGDGQAIGADQGSLHDRFDASQELGAVTVHEGIVTGQTTMDEGALVAADSGIYTVTPDADGHGFTVKLATAASGKPYVVRYTTSLASGYYVTGETGETTPTQVINSLTENGDETTTRTVKVPFHQSGLVKSHTGVDYAAKTVSWSLDVNAAGNRWPLNDGATVTDVYDRDANGAWLGIYRLSTSHPLVLVDSTTGTTLTAGTDYTLTQADGAFTITLHPGASAAYAAGTDELLLSYTLEAVDNAALSAGLPDASNRAELDWTLPDTTKHATTVAQGFSPSADAKANGFKFGTYHAVDRSITWSVGVDYNSATIPAASVIDDLSTCDQRFLGVGTVEVAPLTVASDGTYTTGEALTQGTDYTVSYDEATELLTVTFAGTYRDIDSPYLITFDTSVADAVHEPASSYVNTALLRSEGEPVATLTGSVDAMPFGGSFADKTGVQKATDVDWTVYLNKSQSHVVGAVYTDTYSAGQFLWSDTIALHRAVRKADGTLQLDGSGNPVAGDVVDPGTYEVSLDTAADSFTITFDGAIDDAFVLTYSTGIAATAVDGTTLTNTGALSGQGVKPEEGGSSKGVKVRLSAAWADASGHVANLLVTKVDAEDATRALSGATFELVDSSDLYGHGDDAVLATMTTGDAGTALFAGWKYGSYTFREVSAPEGYDIPADYAQGIEVAISEDGVTVGGRALERGADGDYLLTVADAPIPTPIPPQPVGPQDGTGVAQPGVPTSGLVGTGDTAMPLIEAAGAAAVLGLLVIGIAIAMGIRRRRRNR